MEIRREPVADKLARKAGKYQRHQGKLECARRQQAAAREEFWFTLRAASYDHTVSLPTIDYAETPLMVQDTVREAVLDTLAWRRQFRDDEQDGAV